MSDLDMDIHKISSNTEAAPNRNMGQPAPPANDASEKGGATMPDEPYGPSFKPQSGEHRADSQPTSADAPKNELVCEFCRNNRTECQAEMETREQSAWTQAIEAVKEAFNEKIQDTLNGGEYKHFITHVVLPMACGAIHRLLPDPNWLVVREKTAFDEGWNAAISETMTDEEREVIRANGQGALERHDAEVRRQHDLTWGVRAAEAAAKARLDCARNLLGDGKFLIRVNKLPPDGWTVVADTGSINGPSNPA